jgi:competence protein ComEC
MQIHRAPDVLVSQDGGLMAVRAPDGAMVLSSHGSGKFAAQRWLEDAGQEAAVPWTIRAAPDDAADWLACDAAGCLYRARGRVVALVRDGTALVEDCAIADVVVATFKTPPECRAKVRVVDAVDLWRKGAHAVWLEKGAPARIESVRGRQGERPWVPRRRDRPVDAD